MDDSKSHYDFVFKDLQSRRADVHRQVADLQRTLKEIDLTIQNLNRLIGSELGILAAKDSRPDAQKFSQMSVRWAILCLLSESSSPLTIQDISETLQAGGIRTAAKDFSNNVSAVLSQMKAKPKAEVETDDGHWIITEVGRSAWSHIYSKRQYEFTDGRRW